MDFKQRLLVSSILVCYAIFGSASADSCDLKTHTNVYSAFEDFSFNNACNRLELAKAKLGDLMIECDLGTQENREDLCSESEEREWCSVLDGSVSAPMSSRKNHASYCSVYNSIKACQVKRCDSQGEFKLNRWQTARRPKPDGTTCPIDVFRKCINKVKNVQEVTKDSCIKVAEAKSCYLDELSGCSGSSLQQFGADVLIRGLVHHVRQCQRKGFGFNEDGGICVPNPLDALIPVEILEGHQTEEGAAEKNCRLALGLGNTLERYLKECEVSTWNTYGVNEILQGLSPMRILCLEQGFKAASPNPGLLTTLTTQPQSSTTPLPMTSTPKSKQGWKARRDSRKNAETEFFKSQFELNKIRKEVELRKRVQLDIEFLQLKLKWGLVSPVDVPRLGGEIMSQLA